MHNKNREKTVRLHRLVDYWFLSSLLFFLIIKFLYTIRRLGVPTKTDGWRKSGWAYLRTEQSKFVLTAFKLVFREDQTAPPALDARKKVIIQKLQEFFKNEPETHWTILWTRHAARRQETDTVDFIHANFAEDGSLVSITPFFDASKGIPESLIPLERQQKILQAIVSTYNQTRTIPDKLRPLVLRKRLLSWVKRTFRQDSTACVSTSTYVQRVLSATYIHFEEHSLDHTRFDIPSFITRRHPGWGYMNILCRFNKHSEEVDIWFQYHHTCVDGLPMQEVLSRLQSRFGSGQPVTIPAHTQEKDPSLLRCSTYNGKHGVYVTSAFVDFMPLIHATQEKRDLLGSQVCVTPLRLFAWKLGNHPVFKNIKFLFPIDIPATEERERTLGIVVIRPSLYADPEKGFLEFLYEFDHLVKTTRERKSRTYEMIESFTFNPPFFYNLSLKLLDRGLREHTGTFGISVIKDATVFLAPYTDIHTDGWMGITNFFLPAEKGETVCNISIKGPRDKVIKYLKAVQDVAQMKF